MQSNKSSYVELSQMIEINQTEISFFISHFKLLEAILRDEYSLKVNILKGIDICTLYPNQKYQKETFYKCVSIFILEKRKGLKKFYINIRNDDDAKTYIEILKLLPDATKYEYFVSITFISEIYLIELMKYTKKINYYYRKFDFIEFGFNILRNLIEVECIPYCNIEVDNIDLLLNYSRKYPNKIISLYCLTSNEFEDKLEELIKLNCESLVVLPTYNPKCFEWCKNITTLFFDKLPSKKIPKNFDFTKIEKFIIYLPYRTIKKISFPYHTNEKKIKQIAELYLSYLNLCSNLKLLQINGENELFLYKLLFPILLNLKVKTLEYFLGWFDEIDYNWDFDPILQRFPNLNHINLKSDAEPHKYDRSRIKPNFDGYDIIEIDPPNMAKLLDNGIRLKQTDKFNIRIAEDNSLPKYFQYKKNLQYNLYQFEFDYIDYMADKYNYHYCDTVCIYNGQDIKFFSNFEKVNKIYIYGNDEITDNELITFFKKVKPNSILFSKFSSLIKDYFANHIKIHFIFNLQNHEIEYR